MPIRLGLGELDTLFLGTSELTQAYLGTAELLSVTPPPSGLVLNWQFATNQSLTDLVSAEALSLTRGSSGTFHNSSGVIQTAANDVARFDHNPTSFASLGLLIEEQRTNLITISEDLTDGLYVKSNVLVTADQFLAPDGVDLAELVTSQSSAGTLRHVVTHNSQSQKMVTTFYVRNFDTNRFRFTYFNSSPLTNIDFITETPGADISNVDPGGFDSVTAEKVGSGGWWRITAVATVTGASTENLRWFPDLGSTGEAIFLWGIQCEIATEPSSYIKTTGASASRSADSCTLVNAATYINNSDGTAYISAIYRNTEASVALSLNSGTDQAEYQHNQSADFAIRAVNGAGAQVALANTVGTVTIGAVTKAATRWKASDYAVSVNGAAVVKDLAGAVVTGATRLRIGSGRLNAAGDVVLAHIAEVQIYNPGENDASLQALTT